MTQRRLPLLGLTLVGLACLAVEHADSEGAPDRHRVRLTVTCSQQQVAAIRKAVRAVGSGVQVAREPSDRSPGRLPDATWKALRAFATAVTKRSCQVVGLRVFGARLMVSIRLLKPSPAAADEVRRQGRRLAGLLDASILWLPFAARPGSDEAVDDMIEMLLSAPASDGENWAKPSVPMSAVGAIMAAGKRAGAAPTFRGVQFESTEEGERTVRSVALEDVTVDQAIAFFHNLSYAPTAVRLTLASASWTLQALGDGGVHESGARGRATVVVTQRGRE